MLIVILIVYSDISALLQILSILRLRRPHVSVPAFAEAKETQTGRAWCYARAGFLDQDPSIVDPKLNTEHPETKMQAQQKLGKMLGEFLKTPRPTGNRASQKWLDQDEAQREASNRLWAQMRARHQQTLKRLGIGSEDIEADLRILSFGQEADHISYIKAERSRILERMASKNSSKTSKKSISIVEVQTQWGSSAQDKKSLAAKEPKTKPKTRPDGPVEVQEMPTQDSIPSAETTRLPQQETVSVGKRTLEILQSLFPKRNFEERTKNVDWASFVHAMAEVGFAARQNHGSQYSFDPVPTSKWFGRGRIVFHKPHPSPRYEAWRLLGIGKRMRKWFGWNADTFEPLKNETLAIS